MKSHTGLLYSEDYTRHLTGPNHPERPERVSHVYQHLKQEDFFGRLHPVAPYPAPLEWLYEIHTPAYVERVKNTCLSGAPILDSMDTEICHDSYEVALLAAGGGLALADGVMLGKIRNGFGLIRPPGHHAEKEIALGFCLFNNVAVTARYLQKSYGVKRVLVIDWDVHHGNGTANAFYDDPTVFYFSVHQYPYYPGTGAATERGRGKAIGTSLNVPLPAGSGDREYAAVFEEVFYPRARDFSPEFVLVSAGFDAHQNDPLAHMNVTREGYRRISEVAVSIAEECAGGRIVSLLEGGYDLTALAESVGAHLEVLMECGRPRVATRGVPSRKSLKVRGKA